MTHPLVFQWRPTDGHPRRVTFSADETGWLRIEAHWTGRRWRDVGCERVETLQYRGPTNE